MDEKISVIIPVYNMEKYIRRSLDSILSQIHSNIEIIIVNDGSIDRSGLICDEYSKKYHNIKVINKENGGVSSARNLGINNATGNYISFVDPDDFIEKNMYADLYNAIREYKSDIAVCSVKEIRKDKVITEDNSSKIIKYLKQEAIDSYFNDKYPFNHNYLCNKLFKREIFKDIRLNEKIKYQEDSEIMIKLLDKCESIIYIGEPLYNYDLREDSLSSGKISKGKITAERAFYSIYEYTEKNAVEYKAKALFKYISLVFNIVIEIIRNYEEYKDEYMDMRTKIKEVYCEIIKSRSIPVKYKIHATLIIVSPKVYKRYIQSKL